MIFVHSASSFGRNKFCIEFRSQCHIFRFGNDRRSSRRGLLGGSNCILSRKSVPQGPFGRIKLYFEHETRPAGGLWADKIRRPSVRRVRPFSRRDCGGRFTPPYPLRLGPSPPNPGTNSSIRTLYVNWCLPLAQIQKSCHAPLRYFF